MEYKRYPINADDVFMDGDPNLRYNVPPSSGDLDNLPSSVNDVSDVDLFVTKENNDNWVKKSVSKVWDYIKGKINANEIAPTKITNTTNFNFTSNDTTDANATSWTSVTKVDSVTDISIATFFQRITQMFKNVRYLYKKYMTLGSSYYLTAGPLTFSPGVQRTVTFTHPNIPAGRYLVFFKASNSENVAFKLYNYTHGCGFLQGSWSGTFLALASVEEFSGGAVNMDTRWTNFSDNTTTTVYINMFLVRFGQ